MSEQALRASLLRLQGGDPVPAIHFTAAQCVALDRFARQTGAVRCWRQGRGDVYFVCDQTLFRTHLIDLSPQIEHEAVERQPLRAQHIAHARSSKARDHHHNCYQETDR